MLRFKIIVLIIILPVFLLGTSYYEKSINKLVSNGSVYVRDDNENELIKININKEFIPASILKIITAMAAYNYLGKDFRFKTEFYFDHNKNLYIKGYGDPLLISEEIDLIAKEFAKRGLKNINSIFLDTSFFDKNIKIDGVENSLNPYDTTNGALCVNFNTINVKIDNNFKIHSLEKQTPITGFAKTLIRKKHPNKKGLKDRIVLSHEKNEIILYAGHLFAEFLKKYGIKVNGKIIKKDVSKEAGLFYQHLSSKTLDDIIKSMMKYSTNFTANQIFLSLGAIINDPPASVDKSSLLISQYLKKQFNITRANIVEGSGISRKNKISAKDLMTVLISYTKEYAYTFTNKTGAFYKTGTLSNIKTAAGFIKKDNQEKVYFVIILNNETNFRKRDKILSLIKKMILEN
ncbi:MAG: D-alanyl-D-alanine carboxypeptidase [Pseudomonadota bacterium]